MASARLRASIVSSGLRSSAALASASFAIFSTSSFDRPRRRGDGDLLLVVGAAILRGHVQDAVGIDIERDFDLRHAARSRRNVAQLEHAQQAVVARHGALALVDLDLHRGWLSAAVEKISLLRVGIVVLRSISLVNTPPRVSMPSDSGVTSSSSTSLTSPPSTPPCTAAPTATTSSGFTPLCGSLPNRSRTSSWTARHAGLAAHQHDFVDLLRGDAGIGHRLLAGPDRALQNVFHHLLETRARQLHHAGAWDRWRSAVMNGRLISVSSSVESSILAFSAASFRRCSAIWSFERSMPFSFLNSADDPVDNALVDVVAAQVRVAVGGLHFHHALAHFQDGDIERAAAEVVDGDGLVFLLVESVGQRRRRGLIDDAHHFQAGNLAGVLGGLALRVVEIRRNRDHGCVTFSPR